MMDGRLNERSIECNRRAAREARREAAVSRIFVDTAAAAKYRSRPLNGIPFGGTCPGGGIGRRTSFRY